MFFEKNVYVKRKKKDEYTYEKRGVCLGVYVSKKTGAIRYITCLIDDEKSVDIPVGQIERFNENNGEIYLKNLRTAIPNQCVRITPFLPVYSVEGKYLGRLDGILANGFTVTKLIVGKTKYPVASLESSLDVAILKGIAYPLGEWSEKEKINVSRKLLKEKIGQGKLIEFTLSLPPFSSAQGIIP